MSTALFSGVDHVGVGVGDMDEGIAFYGRVGFSDVLFDWTGDVPGTEALTGGSRRRARVAMLSNPGATPIGPGRVKLVQVLDGDGPPRSPRARAGASSGSARSASTCATSTPSTTAWSPPARPRSWRRSRAR